MTRLLEITEGDQGFVDELIDTFIEDAKTQIEALQAAGAAGDIAAVVRPAHSLKSNAANVGATVLGDLCRTLEVDARAGDRTWPHGSRRSRPSSGRSAPRCWRSAPAAEAGPDGSPFSLFPLTVLMFGAQRAKDE